MQSEASRFDRISALSGTVARIDGALKALGRPSIANADSAALVAVLAVFGVAANADTLNVTLMLLAVAILEVGSGLSLAVAQGMRHVPASSLPVILAPMATTIAATPVALATVAVEPKASTTVKAAAERIRQLAMQSGGTLSAASKREVARLADVSAPTAGRALAFLAASGAVVSNADGIVVRLAA